MSLTLLPFAWPLSALVSVFVLNESTISTEKARRRAEALTALSRLCVNDEDSKSKIQAAMGLRHFVCLCELALSIWSENCIKFSMIFAPHFHTLNRAVPVRNNLEPNWRPSVQASKQIARPNRLTCQV